jgi:23S rRNA-/tRNA-specific pseudouridylate synthase
MLLKVNFHLLWLAVRRTAPTRIRAIPVSVSFYSWRLSAAVHRLDRLTSGVLLFARTQQAAQRLFAQISGRDVRKQYLCRVRGIFPEYVLHALPSRLLPPSMPRVNAVAVAALRLCSNVQDSHEITLLACK